MTSSTPSGAWQSRAPAYQGASRSKNTMEWPARASALHKPRHKVACPLPQDELMVSPKIASLMERLSWRAPRLHEGIGQRERDHRAVAQYRGHAGRRHLDFVVPVRRPTAQEK